MFSINGANTSAAAVATSKFFNKTGIYDVEFQGWSRNSFDSKDGKHFETLVAKFRGTGEFANKEHDITFYMPELTPRTKGQYGYQVGKHEETITNIATILIATSEKYKAHRAAGGSLDGETWDEFRDAIIAYNEDSIGTKTKLKLIARANKQGYVNCNIPGFNLAFTKEQNEKQGEAIMRNEVAPYQKSKWIGKEITFTAKEVKDMNAMDSAAPTAVDDLLGSSLPKAAAPDNSDLNSLLGLSI